MEDSMMRSEVMNQASELARTLLVLNNYEWLKSEAAAIGIQIIPIKGIDLLQNLYAERLDRHVNDIDILCKNDDECRSLVNQLCQEEYRIEFPFAMQPEALASKKKVSLLSCSTTKVNIDVHTAFVTKKFFSQTIGAFNSDALRRCKDGHMDDIDRWLFLAQHAAFHVFADSKWTKDLKLLYDGFSEEEKVSLMQRANEYGFRRVVIAGLYQTMKDAQDSMHHELRRLNPTSSERHFLSFVKHFDRPFSRTAFDRFVSAYLEFTFISSKSHRFKTWLHLLFPSKGLLTNIYRIKCATSIIIFYPLNLLISGLTSILFGLLYIFVCIKKTIAHE